jgi:hypothetical protein
MNYFADDGLQSNEFSDGASWVDATGTILWLVGLRIADPFRITDASTSILSITYQ